MAPQRHSALTRRLIADGLETSQGTWAQAAFRDLPPPIRAAVEAYDAARCSAHGPGCQPMSDVNKLTIAPFIAAAIRAHASALTLSTEESSQ